MKNLKDFEDYFNKTIIEQINNVNEAAQTYKEDKFTIVVDGKAPASFMKNIASHLPKSIK
jgi:hypothetical protein